MEEAAWREIVRKRCYRLYIYIFNVVLYVKKTTLAVISGICLTITYIL